MTFPQKIKQAIGSLLIVSLFLPFIYNYSLGVQRVEASGIPVVDVAHIATAITNAVRQLGTSAIDVAKNTISAVQSVIQSGVSLAMKLKDFVLDGLARAVAQAMIRKITADTVSWINGGFKGKPGFMSDVQGFFMDTLDEEMGRFLEGTELGWLCSPFSLQVRLALVQSNGYEYTPPKCKATDILKNGSDFLNNNGGQGWDNFLNMAMTPTENPYGSYLQTNSQLLNKILNRNGEETTKLGWGQGFMSWQECVEYEATPRCLDEVGVKQGTPAAAIMAGGSAADGGANTACKNTAQPKCLRQQTNTPGSVIQSQINNILPSDLKQLEMADEINEVLSALAGQLFKQVLSSAKGGLLGMSSKNSSGTSRIENINNAMQLEEQSRLRQAQSDFATQQAQLQTEALAVDRASMQNAQNIFNQSQSSQSNGWAFGSTTQSTASSTVGFSPLNNEIITIIQDGTQTARDLARTLTVVAVGSSSDLKFVTTFWQRDPTLPGDTYLPAPMNVFFELFRTTVRKNGQVYTPEASANLNNSTLLLTDKLGINTPDKYEISYSARLREKATITQGQYSLRTEIQDKDNRPLGLQTIDFTVVNF